MPTVRVSSLRRAMAAGHAYVILGGTLVPIGRVAAGTTLLLGKAPQARDEPAGHRQPSR